MMSWILKFMPIPHLGQNIFLKKFLNKRSLSFVIIFNSQIVGGFCIANKVLDECHLQNISVLETMRRQGVGNYMLDILKKRMSLSGITTILLEVRKIKQNCSRFLSQKRLSRTFNQERLLPN